MKIKEFIKLLKTFPQDLNLQTGNNSMRTDKNETEYNLDLGIQFGYDNFPKDKTMTLWFDE